MHWTRNQDSSSCRSAKADSSISQENLGVDPARVGLEMTSPGAVYKNFLILGSRVNESYDSSPGPHPYRTTR